MISQISRTFILARLSSIVTQSVDISVDPLELRVGLKKALPLVRAFGLFEDLPNDLQLMVREVSVESTTQ